MLYRDTHVSRQLACERHAELKQDRRLADVVEPTIVERSCDRRTRFAWLWASLRSNARVPARHAS